MEVLARDTAYPSAPAAGGSFAYVSFGRAPTNQRASGVCAFQVSHGTLAWCKQVSNGSLIVDGAVLFDTAPSGVVALAASTGVKLWSQLTIQPSTVAGIEPSGSLFVAGTYNHGSHLVAISRATGAVLWDVPMAVVYSAPVLAGGMVYASTIDGVVHALRASNGSQAWSFNTNDSYGASMLTANGVIYAGGQTTGSGANDLMAIDATTGGQLWQAAPAPVCDSGLMAVFDDVVVSGNGNTMCGFNDSGGAGLWVYPLQRSVPGAPTVAGAEVYAGSSDTRVYSIYGPTGAPQWATSTGGPVMYSPIVAGGTVLAVSGDVDTSSLHALDATTGQPIWSEPLRGVDTTPIANGSGFVVATDDGTVLALNGSTGATVWTRQLSRSPGVNGMLAVAGNTVFVSWQRIACGCTLGSVVAYNVTTGHKMWSASVGGGGDPLTVSGGALYVAAGGYVWARHATNGKPIWKHKVKDYEFFSLDATGSTVYAGAYKTGSVYALSSVNGKAEVGP